MEKELMQMALNIIEAKNIIKRKNPEEREDFYMLMEGIRISVDRVLQTK